MAVAGAYIDFILGTVYFRDQGGRTQANRGKAQLVRERPARRPPLEPLGTLLYGEKGY